MEPRPDRGSVASVERAGQILRMFLNGRRSVAVTEVAEALGVANSSAHRLLRALCRSELLQRDPVTRRYVLSPIVHGFGNAVPSDRLAAGALVPLERLHRATGEGCHVAVPDLPWIVFVERRDSPSTMRFLTREGMRVPAHCTSTGKVLLAHAPEGVREELIAGDLVRVTPRTLADAASLRPELDRIRERGYAVSRDEMEIGITSMAAPIRDPDGRVVAALGLAGRTPRINRLTVDGLVESVVQAARQVGDGLREPRRGSGTDSAGRKTRPPEAAAPA